MLYSSVHEYTHKIVFVEKQHSMTITVAVIELAVAAIIQTRVVITHYRPKNVDKKILNMTTGSSKPKRV